MTAEFARLPQELVASMSEEILQAFFYSLSNCPQWLRSFGSFVSMGSIFVVSIVIIVGLTSVCSQEILKIDGVGSVFFDVTNKPPGTIEWE